MSLKVGIVGLPNVGKSTLFTALTRKQVDCSNYPFCTIEPNVGIVGVPDERLEKLGQVLKQEKIIPTTIEFVDIAGLVRGASKGEGLGNQFLAHIREVDAIVQVVRGFEDSNVPHVHGKIDPENDIEVVNLELIYADLATVEKRLQGLQGDMKAGETRELKLALSALERIKTALEQGKFANTVSLEEEEELALRDLHLLTAKPFLYVLNVADVGRGFTPRHSDDTLQINTKLEAELTELSETEAKEMMESMGLKESGLDRLIKKSYSLLGLITFFTHNPNEVRAWTVKQGTKAPQAAGVIHTDFEKGFIRAEVVNWKDFVEYGEAGAREKGLIRTEGKDYLVQDGDVCYYRFTGGGS